MRRSQDSPKRSATAYEILAYLAEYSRAQDTLDGIMEWWLLERHVRHQIAQVRDALRDLVMDGLVLEHKVPNLPTRYGINRGKAAEIRSILNKVSAKTTKTASAGPKLK